MPKVFGEIVGSGAMVKEVVEVPKNVSQDKILQQTLEQFVVIPFRFGPC